MLQNSITVPLQKYVFFFISTTEVASLECQSSFQRIKDSFGMKHQSLFRRLYFAGGPTMLSV